MPKQPRIPETRDRDPKPKHGPNREQRRHPERAQDVPLAREPAADEETLHESPELGSVRARSSGHGKKTADKWNQ